MKIAPPILQPSDFFGMKNNIILVEHDEDDCSFHLLAKAIGNTANMIYQANDVKINTNLQYLNTAIINIDSIYKIYKCVRVGIGVEFHVINRIDMMDIDMDKRERGSQMAAYVSMMSSRKILQGANVIVTSAKQEYKLREIADRFICLRK